MGASVAKRGSTDLTPYREHLLNDGKLNATQKRMLAMYRKANALLCASYSVEQTKTVLVNEGVDGKTIAESHAYRIIRDSTRLYGDVKMADKSGMKYQMYESFMLAAALARKNKDHQGMTTALREASKIMDLYNSDVPLDPSFFSLRRKRVFSNAPEAYRQDANTININSEEVK